VKEKRWRREKKKKRKFAFRFSTEIKRSAESYGIKSEK